MYGTWDSPISPAMIAAGLRFNDVQWAGETLVWLEGRGAHSVLVAQTGAQAPRDLTDSEHVGARAGRLRRRRVHDRQRRRLFSPGRAGGFIACRWMAACPQAITPAFGAAAAPRVSPDGRWIVYVHSAENVDGLALVDTEGEMFPRKLAYGTDFVMQPAWHPQGTHIAYIAWNQPQMPWDGTLLQLAHLSRRLGRRAVGAITSRRWRATSIPRSFSRNFRRMGARWPTSAIKPAGGSFICTIWRAGRTRQLTDAEAEDAAPAWVQGVRTYAWSHDGKAIYFIRNQDSRCSLWRCEVSNHKLRRITALDHYGYLCADFGVAAAAAKSRCWPRPARSRIA